MTAMLERAVAAAGQLPAVEQDALAALILAEIEEDQRWEDALARDPAKLEALAARADEQVKSGQCRTAGFDEL